MNTDGLDALRLAKLRALVAGASSAAGVPGRPDWEGRQWEQVDFGPGVALHSPARFPDDPTEVVVHPRATALRSLGEALVWERVHHRAAVLNLVVDAEPGATGETLAGHLQRRARCFARPLVTVWAVTDQAQLRMEPLDVSTSVPPDGLPHLEKPPPAPELVDVLLDAGVEVVPEGGTIRGEVNGLEVARVVHGTSSWGTPLDEPALEVGVGLADRELTGLMHADRSVADQVASAVEVVRAHRQADAPAHPLNRLVPERWLRAQAVRNPDRFGVAEVRPAEAWPPRADLTERCPAVAEGTAVDGRPLVLVFSVGVDVDLVPAATDARVRLGPDAELWLVLPERDCHAATRALADGLVEPAHVVAVPDDWRSW